MKAIQFYAPEDIRYEELLRNKRLKNNKDNYNCNDNNNIKL